MKKKNIKEKLIFSPVKRKTLLLLQAGIVLGFAHSPRAQYFVFRKLKKEWKDVDRQYLYRIIREFKYERLVDYKEMKDGAVRVVLTDKGKQRVLQYKIDKMEIEKPLRWDKKWRLVFFDIPEKRRCIRDILRGKLKNLGFCEIQKSTFIHPYHCKDEIDFLVEFYEIRNCVRYGEISNLTNDAEIKLMFNLK